MAHPNVQQLLASIWYEGLPGFRRKNLVLQTLEVCRIGIIFPFFCLAYMIAPHSRFGRAMRKPFIKFICNSASYFTFLGKKKKKKKKRMQNTQRRVKMKITSTVKNPRFMLLAIKTMASEKERASPPPVYKRQRPFFHDKWPAVTRFDCHFILCTCEHWLCLYTFCIFSKKVPPFKNDYEIDNNTEKVFSL